MRSRRLLGAAVLLNGLLRDVQMSDGFQGAHVPTMCLYVPHRRRFVNKKTYGIKGGGEEGGRWLGLGLGLRNPPVYFTYILSSRRQSLAKA